MGSCIVGHDCWNNGKDWPIHRHHYPSAVVQREGVCSMLWQRLQCYWCHCWILPLQCWQIWMFSLSSMSFLPRSLRTTLSCFPTIIQTVVRCPSDIAIVCSTRLSSRDESVSHRTAHEWQQLSYCNVRQTHLLMTFT